MHILKRQILVNPSLKNAEFSKHRGQKHESRCFISYHQRSPTQDFLLLKLTQFNTLHGTFMGSINTRKSLTNASCLVMNAKICKKLISNNGFLLSSLTSVSCLFDVRIAKICKKSKSNDVFLSYQQNKLGSLLNFMPKNDR